MFSRGILPGEGAADIWTRMAATGNGYSAGLDLIRGVDLRKSSQHSSTSAVIIRPDGSQAISTWELHQAIPTMVGVALGGGIEIDPLEAALAGLAGEPGANVGVNMDEVGIGEATMSLALSICSIS